MQRAGKSPKDSNKNDRGIENMSQEEQMKEVDLFSLQKRRLRRDVIAIFSHLKGQEDDD